MARNRVIYQSEALYVADGSLVPTAAHTGVGKINQLHRVQSANYGFTINRQDVNQFGQLARIDQISIEAPTVNLDFSYYLTTGNNETALGFTVGTGSNTSSFISGLIDASNTTNNIGIVSGRNFHILTVPEGNDANASASGVYSAATARTIGIGNGFITNYTVEAAVGGLPTVSVTAEGLNVNVVQGSSGAAAVVPGINVENGASGTALFILPQPVTGVVGASALRPGDITLLLTDGVVTDLPTGINATDNTAAHVQNLSIEVPIGRTTLERLGSRFGFTKVIDFPVEITVNMSAIVADLKSSGSIASLLDADTTKTLAFSFKLPGTNSGADRIVYEIRGAKLASENFTSTIGDNKSVDLTFTTQVGGPQDTTNGLFVFTNSGIYSPSTPIF
jgi:hypothetical protein